MALDLCPYCRAPISPEQRQRIGGELRFADVVMDTGTREIWRGDRPIALTKSEFELLRLFMEHPRQILSASQLYEQVWGIDLSGSSNALLVMMGVVRRKLGEPRLLHTVRRVGYVLKKPQAPCPSPPAVRAA